MEHNEDGKTDGKRVTRLCHQITCLLLKHLRNNQQKTKYYCKAISFPNIRIMHFSDGLLSNVKSTFSNNN